ncbi:hypothetical protein POTOM_019337 [Populus tomentosa]|uniref:Uncharacterized protein n=1 Tax=Populus tomentosa TaxID=118781 RepID=A0A8X7ZR50_POPTO|nr:hypothetical protein POTOM_019337 [Populus tomentosa]
MQNQNVTRQTRQLESELGGEDCPSTVDSRVSHSNMSIYGQDLMPLHPANFALMNPTPMGSAYSASGNTGEKKPQQPQTLAFKASDISAIYNVICFHQRNHSFPKFRSTQQTNYRVSEKRKSGGDDTSIMKGERKANMAGGKTPLNVGQSIVFSRPDLTDFPVSTMLVNNVVDSLARTLNHRSTPARTSGSVMLATIAAAGTSTRSETPTTSNGSVYSDHVSSSMGTKLPDALFAFPRNLANVHYCFYASSSSICGKFNKLCISS